MAFDINNIQLTPFISIALVMVCVALAAVCYYFGFTEGALMLMGLAALIYGGIRIVNNAQLKQTAVSNSAKLDTVTEKVDSLLICTKPSEVKNVKITELGQCEFQAVNK